MQLPQSPRNQVSSLAAPLTLPRMPTTVAHIKSHGKPWTPPQEILPECLHIACLEPSHTSHMVLSSLGFSPWLPLHLFPRVELVTVPQTLGTDLRFCGARPRHHLSAPNTDVFLKKKTEAMWPGVQKDLFPIHPIQIIFFNVFVLVLCSSSNKWSWHGISSGFSHWKEVTRENNHLLS